MHRTPSHMDMSADLWLCYESLAENPIRASDRVVDALFHALDAYLFGAAVVGAREKPWAERRLQYLVLQTLAGRRGRFILSELGRLQCRIEEHVRHWREEVPSEHEWRQDPWAAFGAAKRAPSAWRTFLGRLHTHLVAMLAVLWHALVEPASSPFAIFMSEAEIRPSPIVANPASTPVLRTGPPVVL